MLIDIHEAVKKYGLKITGVIQVGAHYGEEVADYEKMGVKDMILIEPCENAFQVLHDRYANRPGITLMKYAIGSKTGKVLMNTETANNGQSNSILQPKLHLKQFPDIVFNGKERVIQRKLDDVVPFPFSTYNTLVMDVQGYEG